MGQTLRADGHIFLVPPEIGTQSESCGVLCNGISHRNRWAVQHPVTSIKKPFVFLAEERLGQVEENPHRGGGRQAVAVLVTVSKRWSRLS